MRERDLFSDLEPSPQAGSTRGPRARGSERPRDAGAPAAAGAPLAERMRPRSLDEYVGQRHLVAPGHLVHAMIAGGKLHSLLLWGPPGTGKTTLSRLVAESLGLPFAQLSAVLSGVKELRAIVERAEAELAVSGRPTVVFIDEIHRFNKAQQDALLPHVERGTIILIGATTENPSFEVIAPLLSRSRVLTLEPLDDQAIGALVDRALGDRERGLGALGVTLADDARAVLIGHAQGDARIALGALEVAGELAERTAERRITVEHVQEAVQRRTLRYDRQGEEHYNVISAFIKSMRGSDPDAALYWLVRMLEAGEDPMFVARRMVIFAAEDVGNADPRALQVALAVKDAVHFVGLPEGRIPLAQGATYLATAPKSNASYAALNEITAEVRASGTLPVPLHLRNAPTGLMRSLGYGRDYRYPHDAPGHHVAENYLPDELRGRSWYQPGDAGDERAIADRLRTWRSARDEAPERRRR